MKSLYEIQSRYAEEVIEYLCSYYVDLFRRESPDLHQNKDRIVLMIGKMIDQMLCNTHIVKEYKIESNLYPLEEIRENRIKSVLYGSELLVQEIRVLVVMFTSTGSVKEIRYEI